MKEKRHAKKPSDTLAFDRETVASAHEMTGAIAAHPDDEGANNNIAELLTIQPPKQRKIKK